MLGGDYTHSHLHPLFPIYTKFLTRMIQCAVRNGKTGSGPTKMTEQNTISDPTVLFSQDMSEAYDQKNSKLAAIADNMHFLIRLILKDLPANARILCVGVGTGAEILSMAQEYPEWSFVGVDPSAPMLEVCKKKLEQKGIAERCSLINGYVEDVPTKEKFDAVLSILVAHFIKRADRLEFYTNMQMRLKPGGYFITTELSYDMNAAEFPFILRNWARIQQLMGGNRRIHKESSHHAERKSEHPSAIRSRELDTCKRY